MTMKCAMFPAADGSRYLVIQSCSGVNDGIGTGSSNSACIVISHVDNEEPVSGFMG